MSIQNFKIPKIKISSNKISNTNIKENFPLNEKKMLHKETDSKVLPTFEDIQKEISETKLTTEIEYEIKKSLNSNYVKPTIQISSPVLTENDVFEKVFHHYIGTEENILTNSQKRPDSSIKTDTDVIPKVNQLDFSAPNKFSQCFNQIYSTKNIKMEIVRNPYYNIIKNKKIMKLLQETEKLKLLKKNEIKNRERTNLNNRAKSFFFRDKIDKNFSQKYLI